MRTYRSFGILTVGLIVGTLTIATPVLARPGTPNEVTAVAGGGYFIVQWRNTASEDDVVFDIEGQSDPSVANFNPYGAQNGDRKGALTHYDFQGLAPGRHCFRVWARVGAQGERSQNPSAWACAVVAASAPVHHVHH